MSDSGYPAAKQLPERLFIWGLVDSIELLDEGEGGGRRLFSIDAMVANDRRHFRRVRPDETEHLRRIILIEADLSYQHSPSRRLFDSAEEGSWVRLRVAATGRGAPCQIEGPFPALAPEGGGGDIRSAPLYLARLRWGRRATPQEERRLSALCRYAPSGDSAVRYARQGGALPGAIRIVDAGQAHCAEIYDRSIPGKVLGYFDVGKPTSFFSTTWPSPPPILAIPDQGYVVLSHWDYDHYSMALAYAPKLLTLKWIAPAPLSPGPTVAALIKKLGSAITLIHTFGFALHSGASLHKGLGPATDRNNSGYVLRLSLQTGDVLLTGDVDYQYIDPGALGELKGVLAPHHGAKQVGGPPAPQGGVGRVAFSFGHPNSYGHPNVAVIASHTGAGWVPTATNWSAHPMLASIGVLPPVLRKDFWF